MGRPHGPTPRPQRTPPQAELPTPRCARPYIATPAPCLLASNHVVYRPERHLLCHVSGVTHLLACNERLQAEAVRIARVFNQYDSQLDGRLRPADLRKLTRDLGQELSEEARLSPSSPFPLFPFP